MRKCKRIVSAMLGGFYGNGHDGLPGAGGTLGNPG